MQSVIVNVHSFVDVITNSSTEIFVCNVDKTIDAVKEILVDICSKFQHRDIDNFEEISGMFDEPFIYTKEMYEERYKAEPWRFENEGNIGKIIIQGESDNSIPYEMWPMIEHAFATTSEHLG